LRLGYVSETGGRNKKRGDCDKARLDWEVRQLQQRAKPSYPWTESYIEGGTLQWKTKSLNWGGRVRLERKWGLKKAGGLTREQMLESHQINERNWEDGRVQKEQKKPEKAVHEEGWKAVEARVGEEGAGSEYEWDLKGGQRGSCGRLEELRLE